MERRSYQRVKACLPLKVRVLSPQQVEEAKRACDILSACSSLSQLEEVIERSDLPLPLVEEVEGDGVFVLGVRNANDDGDRKDHG